MKPRTYILVHHSWLWTPHCKNEIFSRLSRNSLIQDHCKPVDHQCHLRARFGLFCLTRYFRKCAYTLASCNRTSEGLIVILMMEF